MRQVKERERKRLEEEHLAEQHKRKVEKYSQGLYSIFIFHSQAKYKQNNADLKKKPFTYDYSGVPIIITNAKVEKFPPSAYAVQ